MSTGVQANRSGVLGPDQRSAEPGPSSFRDKLHNVIQNAFLSINTTHWNIKAIHTNF